MVDPSDYFQPSRFMRWALVPVLVAFALWLPLGQDEWNTVRVAICVTLSSLALLYAAALLWPRRCAWAARAVCGLVFLAFVAYFLDEWIVQGEPIRAPRRPGESSAGNALAGLVAIGLPCLLYALRRRERAAAPFADESECEDDGCEDDGYEDEDAPAPASREAVARRG
jgi:hypothetical protein